LALCASRESGHYQQRPALRADPWGRLRDDKASAIAHKADDEGSTLREAALAVGVSAADFDRIVDPKSMVGIPAAISTSSTTATPARQRLR
jgi:hypothetical protein